MSPTNRYKYKYFHSTVQRAKDRRQKFHFCRLPFDVLTRNVKLNLSNAFSVRLVGPCFRQTAPLRESRVAFSEDPQKNGERANLALYFHKAACRFNPDIVF